MKTTITNSIIAAVKANPNSTAWQISHRVLHRCDSVSAILNRCSKRGQLQRKREGNGPWRYYHPDHMAVSVRKMGHDDYKRALDIAAQTETV